MDIPIFSKVTDKDFDTGVISTEEVIAGMAKHSYEQHNRLVTDTINDPELQKIMRVKQYEADLHNARRQEGGFAKYVGSFPSVLIQKIEEMYGPEAFKDKKLFRHIMLNDPVARGFCLIDPTTI